MKTPISVIICAIIILISSILGLYGLYWLYFNNPPMLQNINFKASYYTSFIVLPFSILLALFIIKGKNWARLSYVILKITGIVSAFIFSGTMVVTLFSSIPVIGIFLLQLMLLYNRKANAFFKCD